MGEPTTTKPTTASTDFVPIGVWVCNWADIFPWLATGYCHSIDDTTAAEIMVKFRMMGQDFVTLSRLYRYAAELKLVIAEDSAFKAGDGKVCGQIADSFASAYASLADANPAEPADYKAAAAAAHKELGKDAKKIYEIWDQTPCLRSAELGLGYMKEGGQSLQTRCQFNIGINMPVPQWVPVSQITYYDLGQCTFGGSNFSAFAQFYKVLPLILPQSGKIIAFGEAGFIGAGTMRAKPGVFGPGYGAIRLDKNGFGQGLPYEDQSGGNVFSIGSGNREFKADTHRGADPFTVFTDVAPIEFKFIESGNYLENTDRKIKLYPIPLSAARNIEWKGQSFSTNVKADAELNQRLAEIVKELEESKALWSWSSDLLSSDWNAQAYYLPETLRQEYFGLVKDTAKVKGGGQ
jgi:hypothetical protein